MAYWEEFAEWMGFISESEEVLKKAVDSKQMTADCGLSTEDCVLMTEDSSLTSHRSTLPYPPAFFTL